MSIANEKKSNAVPKLEVIENPKKEELTCEGCSGQNQCEYAYLNCHACTTHPEFFVSQK